MAYAVYTMRFHGEQYSLHGYYRYWLAATLTVQGEREEGYRADAARSTDTAVIKARDACEAHVRRIWPDALHVAAIAPVARRVAELKTEGADVLEFARHECKDGGHGLLLVGAEWQECLRCQMCSGADAEGNVREWKRERR